MKWDFTPQMLLGLEGNYQMKPPDTCGLPRHFVDLVLGSTTESWSPGEAALRSVLLLDAAHSSAASGRTETVSAERNHSTGSEDRVDERRRRSRGQDNEACQDQQ